MTYPVVLDDAVKSRLLGFEVVVVVASAAAAANGLASFSFAEGLSERV